MTESDDDPTSIDDTLCLAFHDMIKSKDVYLSSEERYEDWMIKQAERPEILDVFGENDASEGEH